MKEVIYSKYNLNRNPKFQTKTVIYQEGRTRYIEKTALTKSANSHISEFKMHYSKIRNMYPQIKVIDSEFEEGLVRYPYIEGDSLDADVEQWIADKTIAEKLSSILEDILVPDDAYKCKFSKSQEFIDIFGDVDCLEMDSLNPCNVDMVFDNLRKAENSIVLFDYEWVFDFPVPQKYVVYRILCQLYIKFYNDISSKYSLDEFFEMFGFSSDEKQKFRRMEDSLIAYIYTGGDPAFSGEKYAIPRPDFYAVQQTLNDYSLLQKEYKKTIDLLHDTETKYKVTIDLLHDTETKYKVTIDRLEYAAKLVTQLENSRSWKLTKPLRDVEKVIRSIKKNGVKGIIRKAGQRLFSSTKNNQSGCRFAEEFKTYITDLENERQELFKSKPKISILTPLFHTPERYLIELIDSVQNQTYGNWELILVNFGDDEDNHIDHICLKKAENDKRIVYKKEIANYGISENTNICIRYSTGDYIALLDHDDVLHPSALFEAAKAIETKNADFIYSDEIKFEEDINNAFQPNFKPDFSADELRAHNYICHLCVYKKSLLDKAGLYRADFDGSQDHDMVLRLTEIAEHIVHIPRILYFWRVHPGSVALNINEKSYATKNGEKAVTEQLARKGFPGYAESIVGNIPIYRLKNSSMDQIPITVLVWGSTGRIPQIKFDNVRILHIGNSPSKWNRVMKEVRTDYVLFISDEVKSVPDEAITELSLYCSRSDVCALDARIVCGEQIVSGGLYLSGDRSYPWKLRCEGKPVSDMGYENVMMHQRNLSAALGVCTVLKRSIWDSLGGFDESSAVPVLDLTFRAGLHGFVTIWSPFVIAETITNITDQIEEKLVQLNNHEWPNRDPYVNPKIFIYGLE